MVQSSIFYCTAKVNVSFGLYCFSILGCKRIGERNLSGVVLISKESQHIRSPVLLPLYIVKLLCHVLTA